MVAGQAAFRDLPRIGVTVFVDREDKIFLKTPPVAHGGFFPRSGPTCPSAHCLPYWAPSGVGAFHGRITNLLGSQKRT